MTLEEAERAQIILDSAFEAAGIVQVGIGITKLEYHKPERVCVCTRSVPSDPDSVERDYNCPWHFGGYTIHLAIQEGANLDAIYIGKPIAQEDIDD